MSNEPLPSEPTASEPAPPASGRSVDAELVLAAIDRMEAALRRERVALDRLYAELAAMAQTIAQAKIAVQPGAVKPDAQGAAIEVAALLDELEHRVDAMLEVGGRFSREKTEAVHRPAETSGGEGSAPGPVILEAMVLALSALEAVNLPKTAARDVEEAPPEEPAQAAEQPALTPKPSAAILPENELMSSFARMEAFPIPPRETGTAVIFEPRQRDPAPIVSVQSQPGPVAQISIEQAADGDLADFLFDPPSHGSADPANAEPADDSDPASFLLESLPQPPAAAPALPTPPSGPPKSAGAAPAAARADPLAPLNAMTAAEKIALFS
jgi:hypothetical protein